MESAEELTARRLENRTYRQLQQMAKSMGLPSNFKKIYLIELIVAKRFKSDTEVVGIIHRVRQERLYQSKVKKRSQLRKIKYQVSSQRIPEPRNSICYSPPITVTPKRSSNVDMQYSPEIMCKAIVPINPKRNLMRNITNTQNTIMPPISSSDRVLRSYNMKTLKPNYALINNNIEEIKTQCCSDTERKFKIITNRGFPQFNVRAKCYVRRNKSLLEDNSRAVLKRQYIIPHGRDVTRTPLPAKRQRTISGIYPLNPEETVPRNLATNQSVCLRKTDGSYTRINALVQKCNVNVMKINNRSRNPEINIEEIIDKIDVNMPEDLTNENNNYLKIQYPNTSGLDLITSDSSTQIALHHHFKENVLSSDTQLLEYENKSRTEQLRCQRIWDMGRQKLPKINDAFSRFSNVHWRDPTQPLYVQVGTELENVPIHMNTQPTLETVYNIRTTAPPTPNVTRPINSTTCTNCVDTIRTYPTVALFQSKSAPANDALNVNSLMLDNNNYQYTFNSDMRLQEFLQLQPAIGRNYGPTTDYSSSSSVDTMDTSASIPEMVEDALEIISQDGDYMERMGMNTRIQCVLCSWAGPKIILEGHIRKVHTESIHKQYKSEWNTTYTLESLVQCRVWFNRVIEYDSMLYMLSAKYEDPGCFMATLTSLSTEPEPSEKIVSITLYNKITGEPFSWTGHIPTLPPNLPYENNAKCLKIDLSKLDLLPNSANLKLINRELVTQSPNKVVVGHPALNDIHIIVFVRVFN